MVCHNGVFNKFSSNNRKSKTSTLDLRVVMIDDSEKVNRRREGGVVDLRMDHLAPAATLVKS